MKFRQYLASTLLIVLIVCLIHYQTIMAFDTSQKLLYEGSYILNQYKFSNSLTFKIDYFHEITSDVFLEGNLVIRASNEQYGDPFVIGPNEIYVSAYNIIENLDLKAGKIINRWGAADMFSPLDNFNPTPPGITFIQNHDKLGVLGINASYYVSDLTLLQAVLVPRLGVTPYPDQYLKDTYLATYGPIYQAQGYIIDDVDLSYDVPESFIWGLRLNHSFSSFDAAINYYNGYYRDPLRADLKLIADPNKTSIKINLGYPAKQVVGLEFQGEFPGIEGATLRGDLAYIIPEKWSFQGEDLLDNPYFKAIISADYTTESNLYLNGGFIYGMTFEKGDDCSPYAYLNANKNLEKSELEPFYIGILSLEDMSMGNIVGIDYQISESVSTSLSYLFLSQSSGSSESNLSILKNSEGFYFSIEWLF
jgi:hypothetical protein